MDSMDDASKAHYRRTANLQPYVGHVHTIRFLTSPAGIALNGRRQVLHGHLHPVARSPIHRPGWPSTDAGAWSP